MTITFDKCKSILDIGYNGEAELIIDAGGVLTQSRLNCNWSALPTEAIEEIANFSFDDIAAREQVLVDEIINKMSQEMVRKIREVSFANHHSDTEFIPLDPCRLSCYHSF